MEIQKLKKFFWLDKRMKDVIYNMAPVSELSFCNDNEIFRYSNTVNDSLKYLFSNLKDMASIFGEENIFVEKINELEKDATNYFIECKNDVSKLKYFYKYYISDMKEEFVDLIKSECVGYSMFNFPSQSLVMVSSVNEMLHSMHAFVMNNEYIYKNVNVIDQKNNTKGSVVSLYGDGKGLGKDVYDQYDLEVSSNDVDIVSIDKTKSIMMIRDRGHALTIEIDKVDDEYRIDYFVPKLCNIDMINKLPGVNKVNEDSFGATGIFYINNLNDLYKFISMVPTDGDMIEKDYFVK